MVMKIKSYKKIKDNTYRISFQNDANDILLYADVILKYNLLLRKEISKEELNKILKENNYYACYYKAISYLSYKMRSKKELRDYLKKQKFFTKDIETTINILEEKNLLNDDEYLKIFINNQLNLSNNGPTKIKNKLLELGFGEEQIEEELSQVDYQEWLHKLEKIIEKKLYKNKKDGINKIKEKIIYSCLNEGFLKEDIVAILNRMDIPENNDSLKKETIKLYKKLSNKYKGEELFYQLKGRLYNKGFSSDAIDDAINEIKYN